MIHTSRTISILWVDDEIDLLRPHVLFLEQKGYKVYTATNGYDALDIIATQLIDIVLLDENMPGLSGLETLSRIKMTSPGIPIIMITKSEEENIMDQAIGSKISDYLIKPVNPNQILLSIKKNTESLRLVNQQTTSDYQTSFAAISIEIGKAASFEDFSELYRKLVYWDLELESLSHSQMLEILQTQKTDANLAFSKWIRKQYVEWISDTARQTPLMSSSLLKQEVFPLLQEQSVFLIVIDNLRFDQWKAIAPLIAPYYKTEKELLYLSILPTVTQYARNALFSGWMPRDIQQKMPDCWTGEEEHDEGHNDFEHILLQKLMDRCGIQKHMFYEKFVSEKAEKKILERLPLYLQNDLTALVFNFVDQLSHARTDVDMIRQLANDEAAYRTLTRTWFEHSPLFDLLKQLSGKPVKVVITTDHGSIKVTNPIRVVGDRESSVNIRYKQGRKLAYDDKHIFEVKDPAACKLPKTSLTSSYIFASGNDYMVYPKNYNQFVNYYKNTFQHGGISLEEMLVPLIVLNPL